MKLCWDNIENVRLSENGNFRDMVKKQTYHLKECKRCKQWFLGVKKQEFCVLSCSKIDKKHSEETKRKISKSAIGRKHSKETKEKMSKDRSGDKNSFFGKHHTEETKKKISDKNKNPSKEKREKLRNAMKGKKLSEETKRKISESLSGEKHPFFGKHHTEETKKKISDARTGQKINKDGGYNKDNIPKYITYFEKLEPYEKTRRNKKDPNVLEVKCFKCNNWHIPKLTTVWNRIQFLKGSNMREQRFYCSEECKQSCSIFGKSINTIMKEDAVRAGRLPWLELRREVQPELRQMVLERDEHKCVKCNDSNNLECHHILPVNIEPLLSADINNCITLCEKCHKEVHKEIDGCNYNQLHIEEC